MDGGLYTGDVTEIVGAAGAGKSQICMNISLFTALEAKKHLVYIDTGGSFCGARLKEMLTESKSCDDDQEIDIHVLSRISVFQAFDIFSMIEALESVRQSLSNEGEDANIPHLKLIIVDCLAAVVSPILGGQQIHDNQQCGHRFLQVVFIFCQTCPWPNLGSCSKHEIVYTKTDWDFRKQKNCHCHKVYQTESTSFLYVLH